MRIYYTMASLLVIFCGFFLNIISISPIYISFSIVVLLNIILFFRKPVFKIDEISLYVIAFIIYLIITQIIVLNNDNHAMYNVLFSLIYCVVSMRCLSKVSGQQLIDISVKFINFNIIILTIEAIYRWLHPQSLAVNASEDIAYYKYKYSSIMYLDSNFVGIYAVAVFFLGTYLVTCKGVKLKKQQLFLALIIIATLSKASIIALVIFGYVYQLRISKSLKKLILIFIIALAGYELVTLFMNIGTMARKIYAVEETWKYLRETNLFSLLFGVGFGNTGLYIRNGGHNIILVYIVESGIIGLSLLLFLFVIFYKRTNSKFGIVLFPFLFVAISMVGHATQYLYVIAAIIYYLEKNNKNVSIMDV